MKRSATRSWLMAPVIVAIAGCSGTKPNVDISQPSNIVAGARFYTAPNCSEPPRKKEMAPILLLAAPLLQTAVQSVLSFTTAALSSTTADNTATTTEISPSYQYRFSLESKKIEFTNQRCLVFVRGKFAEPKSEGYPNDHFDSHWNNVEHFKTIRREKLPDLYETPDIFLEAFMNPSSPAGVFKLQPVYLEYRNALGGSLLTSNHDLVVTYAFQTPGTDKAFGSVTLTMKNVKLPLRYTWYDKSLGWINFAPVSQATKTLVSTYAKSPQKEDVDLEPINITIGIAETSSADAYLKALSTAIAGSITSNSNAINTGVAQNIIPAAMQAAEATQAATNLKAAQDEINFYSAYDQALLAYSTASGQSAICAAYTGLVLARTNLNSSQNSLKILGLKAQFSAPKPLPSLPSGC